MEKYWVSVRLSACARDAWCSLAQGPKVGMKYYQELAPGVAMDRAEVVSLDEVLDTPAGSFTRCLKTKEGTALDAKEQQFKIYAPGIGLVDDEGLLATEHGFMETQ